MHGPAGFFHDFLLPSLPPKLEALIRRNDLLTEFNALLPGSTTEAGPSRRTALKVSLGASYAASTLPTLAQSAIRRRPLG